VGGETAGAEPHGHLSNHAVSEYLADPDGSTRGRFLVLAHLSLENNNPDLARFPRRRR